MILLRVDTLRNRGISILEDKTELAPSGFFREERPGNGAQEDSYLLYASTTFEYLFPCTSITFLKTTIFI